MGWDGVTMLLHMAERYCQTCPPTNFSEPDLTRSNYVRIYKLIVDDGLVTTRPREEKSRRDSENLRNAGNAAYANRDNKTALRLYTQAVCAAPPSSKESALAYANRSAVAYDMKKYNDSIVDIDRALSNDNYPDRLRHKLYERRGKCHMALEQFSKALEDFELAINRLQNQDRAQEKVAQIETLMGRCRQPDVPQQPFKNPIRLSHEPSPVIQCSSAALGIDIFPGMGRGVVATRDLTPGDVLAIEKRYAACLLEGAMLDYCDYCLKECHSVIPCSTCRTVVFCSEECRTSSWTSYHSMECGILPSLLEVLIKSNMEAEGTMKAQLALRLFLQVSNCGKDFERLLEWKASTNEVHKKSGFVQGQYLSDNYEPILHLVTNMEKIDSDILVVFQAVAVYLMSLLKEGGEFFESLDKSVPRINELFSRDCPGSELNLMHLTVADILLKFVLVVNANVLQVEDPASFNSIGGGIYAFCHSLFNHSCIGDVESYPYSSDAVFIVAVQPVKAGRQVFANYGFSYVRQPRSYRQSRLDLLSHFTCECTACVEDWPTDDAWPVFPTLKPTATVELRVLLETALAVEPVCHNVNQGNGTQEDLNFLAQIMKVVFEQVELPWGVYRRCQEAVRKYRRLQAYPRAPGTNVRISFLPDFYDEPTDFEPYNTEYL